MNSELSQASPMIGHVDAEASSARLVPSQPGTYDVLDVFLLGLTILSETGGTLLLRHGNDVGTLALGYLLYFLALSLFVRVLRTIPLSIAYATWCSLGTVGIVSYSVLVDGEQLSRAKISCIACIVPCVAGLFLLP